jgi:DNA invertase Pin-like site-specific DNA recombinase
MKIANYQIFSDEGISGSKFSRPSLDKMMTEVRAGHVEKVIVYSFSRFARSVTHLLNALEEFRKYETAFISYTEQVDTNSPMGRAFFTIIAAISQLERELIVERVKNGLRNAKLKGKQIGRKKTRNSELIRSLLNSGMTLRAAARVANCSHGSVSLERAIMKREAIEAKKVSKELLALPVISPIVEIIDKTEENPEGKMNFSLSFA